MTYAETIQKRAFGARSGFTMIELMIGIVIIGLITGGAIYTAMTVMERAKKASTKTTIQTIKSGIMSYKQDKGEYPKSLNDLIATGDLKKPLPKDGWDRAFVYRVTPDGKHPYELYSHGPEGKSGGKVGRIDAWTGN